MYEAHAYSNPPKLGKEFSKEYSTSFDAGTGTLDENTTEGTASRIASPEFDQSAGVKPFKLSQNQAKIIVSGSYHGVSGTYSCTPDTDNTCAVRVASEGFDLGGLTDIQDANTFDANNAVWTFKPTNPNARVMAMLSSDFVSYGWWLHKSADGNTWTASAFAANKGTVETASGIVDLKGTAKYVGGAAGKYALHSSTGGTNDAGHFTAKATLEADFNADMITGTINEFIGADGQSRDWSVELKKSGISDSGTIRGADGMDDSTPMKTVWTIGDTAAPESGQWSGSLWDNGDDNVPEVATGTFFSTHNNDGRMVGAFGANKQ